MISVVSPSDVKDSPQLCQSGTPRQILIVRSIIRAAKPANNRNELRAINSDRPGLRCMFTWCGTSKPFNISARITDHPVDNFVKDRSAAVPCARYLAPASGYSDRTVNWNLSGCADT